MSDDYADDDFESYDDDFEETAEEKPVIVEDKKVASAKASVNVSAHKPTEPNINASYNIPTSAKSISPAIALPPAEAKGSKPNVVDEKRIQQSRPNNPKPNTDYSMNMDFSTSIKRTTVDPRWKRLQRLRGIVENTSSGAVTNTADPKKKSNGPSNMSIVDMQEESFQQLNLLPISCFDMYYQQLRVQPVPPIKQIGN